MTERSESFEPADLDDDALYEQIPLKRDGRSEVGIGHGARHGYLPPDISVELLDDVEKLNALTDAEVEKIEKIIDEQQDYS